MTRSEGCLAVGRVPAEATFALRQEVLRPQQSRAEMALPGDDDPGTVFLAAFGASHEVLSTLRLQPATCPWFPGRTDAWQLRGMATAEQHRGRGLGGVLVAAAVRHIAERGGGLLWCNARVPAETFYARAGFTATDQRWDDPAIGPHVGMTQEVPAE